MIHQFTAKARHLLNQTANSPGRQSAAQADLVNLIVFSAVQTGYVQLTTAASFLKSSGVRICTVHNSLGFQEHQDISCMNSLEKSDWGKRMQMEPCSMIIFNSPIPSSKGNPSPSFP